MTILFRPHIDTGAAVTALWLNDDGTTVGSSSADVCNHRRPFERPTNGVGMMMPFLECKLKNPVVPIRVMVVVLLLLVLVTAVGKVVMLSFAAISTIRSFRCLASPFAIITRLLPLMVGGGGGTGGGRAGGAGDINIDRCPSPPPPQPAARSLSENLFGCLEASPLDKGFVAPLVEHAMFAVEVAAVLTTGDEEDGEIEDATVPKVVEAAAAAGESSFPLWWKNS